MKSVQCHANTLKLKVPLKAITLLPVVIGNFLIAPWFKSDKHYDKVCVFPLVLFNCYHPKLAMTSLFLG